jgi:hypothetical protein
MAQRMPDEEAEESFHDYQQKERPEDIAHETKVAVCAVTGNKLGEVSYCFYMEDPHNLGEPIGFSIEVLADGTIELEIADADQMLSLLNPEHSEKIDFDRTAEDFAHVQNLHALRVKHSVKRKRNTKKTVGAIAASPCR